MTDRPMTRLCFNRQDRTRGMRERYRSAWNPLLQGKGVVGVVSRMMLEVLVSKVFEKIFPSIFLERLRETI